MLVPMVAFAQAKPATGFMQRAEQGQDLYATIKTNQGDIVVRLFSKDAPKTVANFVGLATGEKEWTHPGTGAKQTKRLYDDVIFHRVIPGFMIQGGDPLGQGIGGPGYRFEDEFKSGRKFDKPGLLAMANSGPNTNGSQFFITVAPTPHLDNRHTIFGEVVEGQDVVEKISKLKTTPQNRPLESVVIKTIEISAEPKKAKKPKK
ncbi:MAG: peptidylprolyl isomerase [Myxococcaceae bacterium]